MEKILIVDHIEDILKDGEKVGIECFDKTGDSVKVKVGKGGSLKKKWDELVVSKAYSFEMGEFKGYPFVADFKSVESKFVEQAQKQVETKTLDTRDKSMAISYSKDLVCAGKVDITELITQAKEIYEYITGGYDEALQVHKEITTAFKAEPDEEVSADEIRQETSREPINMEWLKDSLNKLQWTDVVGWMQKKYEIKGGKTVRGVLEFMNDLQEQAFIAEVKQRLEDLDKAPF